MTAIEQPNQSYSENALGTRGLEVLADYANCQRITSPYVSNGLGGFEAGYVIGFSTCQGYTGHYYDQPTPFVVGRYSNGAAGGCQVFGGRPQTGSTAEFQASNQLGTQSVNGYVNRNPLLDSPYYLDFSQGNNLIGMERATAGDNGYAKWGNLEEYHNGNGWTRFENVASNSNADPDFHWVFPDGHSAYTKQ